MAPDDPAGQGGALGTTRPCLLPVFGGGPPFGHQVSGPATQDPDAADGLSGEQHGDGHLGRRLRDARELGSRLRVEPLANQYAALPAG